jgi:hypothetical protein
MSIKPLPHGRGSDERRRRDAYPTLAHFLSIGGNATSKEAGILGKKCGFVGEFKDFVRTGWKRKADWINGLMEISAVMNISVSTVKNYWTFSRAWLFDEISSQ